MVINPGKNNPDYPSCLWTRGGANICSKNKYDKAVGLSVINDIVHFLVLDQSEQDFVSGGYIGTGRITTGNRTFILAGVFSNLNTTNTGVCRHY